MLDIGIRVVVDAVCVVLRAPLSHAAVTVLSPDLEVIPSHIYR